MAKITNEQKLDALKAWLKENNIAFIENYESRFGITMDLKLPDLMIAVFLSDDKDREEEIYNLGKERHKMRFTYKPFFIRESETKEFILEKIQNCCFERMVWLQRRFEKANNK